MASKSTETPLIAHGSTTEGPTQTDGTKEDEFNEDNPDNLPVYHRSSTSFRWVVLALSCFAMFGSYYCYDTPTALAEPIKEKYDLSHIEFNLLYTVYSIPNIVLPLFGGALVDKFGAELSLLFFLSLCTIGQALFAFAGSIKSYPLMLVARVVFGLGGESLCVAESALLAVYFVGTEVAFAMGLNLSLARAGSALNDYVSLKVYETNDSIPLALWVGFILLCVCLAFTVLMVVLDRLRTKSKFKEGYFVPQAHSGEIVQLSDIKEFDLLYWLLTVSCIVVYGCVLPWNNIGGAFMQTQYGYNHEKANTLLMIPYLTSAICTPFFGYACDRIGRRGELLVASAAALTASHFLFAWITALNPIVPLLFLGIAYSIYASAIWPAISLVVKESKLGTAYGFITALQNGGLALFPIIVGALTGLDDEDGSEYFYVEIFFFSLGIFGTLIGFMLLYTDNKNGAKLSKPSIQKKDSDCLLGQRLLDYREKSIEMRPTGASVHQ